jgi:AraC family transcriptional regulator of adaptative response/methylated-DNA-[protein]-cysteine methyltransferase
MLPKPQEMGVWGSLFMNLEAMSPGEFIAGGAGLQIRYGSHATPFGTCLIATTPRGICHLHFLDPPDPAMPDQQATERWLRSHWENADIQPDQVATQALIDRLFNSGTPSNTKTEKPLHLHVKGTNFQIQVWRALLQIPCGQVTTYQGLATAIGRPTAARAIGNAVGRNPVAYLIPCHRVIRQSGELGGFRWGLQRKAALLNWEANQAIAEVK